MKKILLAFIFIFMFFSAFAAGSENSDNITLSAIWVTAFLAAVIHTIAGPDHYLPFIAIAKSRNYSLKKTLIWTFICGIGHIGSALLIALLFIGFSNWLSEANLTLIEDNRSDIAAYALIGAGAAYLLWALRHRMLHKHGKEHTHIPTDKKNITIWVIFIIFVLGPCEALLPILTASSVLGTPAIVSSTIIFSAATIATMMIAVSLGILGLNALRMKFIENYAHEIAGLTIMLCGTAILCGL